MNIQIFGTKKSFDCQKAERYFKERGIKFQSINLKEKEMSRGEFNSVMQACGGIDAIIDKNAKDEELLTLLNYLRPEDKIEKVFDNQQLLLLPIVRNGKKATVGYCPDIWKDWE